MRRLVASAIAALVAATPFTASQARNDPKQRAAPTTNHELVVFEADGCIYCENFRADVLPLYASSALGKEAPIRFVNVSRSDETKMRLNGAITIAPTVVLMRDGQEVDRITGYTGPFNFLKLVNYMMGRDN